MGQTATMLKYTHTHSDCLIIRNITVNYGKCMRCIKSSATTTTIQELTVPTSHRSVARIDSNSMAAKSVVNSLVKQL